ncbi:hypothetical protein [Symmachiella macrocystis]|uniref:hypothetical protein n=1 Tax=Symmachiella macrocystis TaxID=2527985 RepID=UPI0011B4D0FF|nr:hypothetical protein [Symmachiella macrocystis]
MPEHAATLPQLASILRNLEQTDIDTGGHCLVGECSLFGLHSLYKVRLGRFIAYGAKHFDELISGYVEQSHVERPYQGLGKSSWWARR